MAGGGQRPNPMSRESKDPCCCRMVVLGAPGVGKTALTVRLLTKRFISEYCPTLESVYKYQTQIENDEAKIEILDTAGQVESMKDGYAMLGDCFIFVYSITDIQSFNIVKKMKRNIEETRRSTPLVSVLLANKSDLGHERQVSREEGADLAEEFQSKFYEISAADGNHVTIIREIFHEIYKEFKKKKWSAGRGRKASASLRFKYAIQRVILGGKNNSKQHLNSL